jgi:hypothetical protein
LEIRATHFMQRMAIDAQANGKFSVDVSLHPKQPQIKALACATLSGEVPGTIFQRKLTLPMKTTPQSNSFKLQRRNTQSHTK